MWHAFRLMWNTFGLMWNDLPGNVERYLPNVDNFGLMWNDLGGNVDSVSTLAFVHITRGQKKVGKVNIKIRIYALQNLRKCKKTFFMSTLATFEIYHKNNECEELKKVFFFLVYQKYRKLLFFFKFLHDILFKIFLTKKKKYSLYSS